MHADVRRHGIALIEVLAAIVVLGLSGSALVRYVGESAAAAHRAGAREAEVVRAASVLVRLSLLRPSELQALEGASRIDGFEVRVDRVDSGLFRVAVHTPDGRNQLLETHFAPRSVGVTHAP